MARTRDSDLEQVDLWNSEDASDLERPTSLSDYNIAIAARDWTVETIVQQVRQGNIDLDPAFQRRNAWRDQRRSRLIESFILGFPVPQIVLAENPHKKKTFIVIDGKQRLMTIAGVYLNDFREYWTQQRLIGLNVLKDLNRVSLDDLQTHSKYAPERRQLGNADIRTTVITGFSDEAVLYDIFYRINTGSVPLSSQELRQVLNQGAFAIYLNDITSRENDLWRILEIESPDPRLRDAELLLRLIAWRRHAKKYVGNMKPFLDYTMKELNDSWLSERPSTEALIENILKGVRLLSSVFGEHVGRKFKDGRFEPSLNRALFEVQAYYFSFREIRDGVRGDKKKVVAAFKELSEDTQFLSSIESTTKSIENYRVRFDKYRHMLKTVVGQLPDPLPLGSGTRAK